MPEEPTTTAAVSCNVTCLLWRRRIRAPKSTDFVVPLRGCGRVPLCLLSFRAEYLVTLASARTNRKAQSLPREGRKVKSFSSLVQGGSALAGKCVSPGTNAGQFSDRKFYNL